MADETGGVAFALYPTSMEELMQIADEGRLALHRKSTWFEPKLRSGFLFISFLKKEKTTAENGLTEGRTLWD